MKDYKYQDEFIKDIAYKIKEGFRKIVCQLATGGGKTVVFGKITSNYISKNEKSVLILVHREELLRQARNTLFGMYGIESELVVSGKRYIPKARVYIGMVESANNRIEKLHNVGLVIIDECHIGSFHKMHSHFPDQIILGFSATPKSSSKRFPLNLFYDTIVACKEGIPELIKDGYLCQNITRAPKDIVDRNSLKVKGDDFDEVEMAKTFSQVKYVNNAVSAYEKWAKGTKTVIFNVNIEHSKQVCKAFQDAGFNCKHLDGTMKKERQSLLTWLKNTPDAILCNVGVLTAGFDEKSIESVIVNRATQSDPLWIQMTGRGSRSIEGKNYFNIIDLGGNAMYHGDWCDQRDWVSIFENPPKPGKSQPAPVKTCPQCEGIVHASCRICPLPDENGELCGYEWPVKEKSEEEMIEDFVIITKGIDAGALIQANKERKEFFSLFRIGTLLAMDAKKTIQTEFTDDIANFILSVYIQKGKEWAKKISEKRESEWNELSDKPKKVVFSQWHQQRAKDHLFKELKRHFPTWQSNSLESVYIPEHQTQTATNQ